MFKSLNYSVEFPTTGRSFQNQIEFAPGLTAITGRNEAGKTIILEMIGYALFGKAALRGLASDYRNLAVSLVVDVNGQEWVLDRARKETFTVSGEVVAVGADAINREVPARLGFGLDVWNIALAAQQGDLGALTEMRPTARREMIDRLIGINLLEDIEKDCRQEAKTQDTVASSLILSQAVPQEPIKPEDYVPSAELEQTLVQVQEHERERVSLLRMTAPMAPEPPQKPPVIDVEGLEQHEADRQTALQMQARLEGQLRGMPEPRYSREDLEKAVAYGEYEAEVRRRGPRPDVEIGLLRDMERALDVQQRAGDEVECPSCNHHFHLGISPEDETWLGHVVPLTRAQITTEFRRHELWATPLSEVPEFTIPNLQQEILAHAHADERNAVVSELSTLTVPDDRSGQLRAARDYQRELAIYGERAARYDLEMAGWKAGQARLRELGDRSGELADLQRRLGESRAYELALGRYADQRAAYDELCGRARDARDAADGFKRGALSLRNARVRVKQELAPSLSKAASSLISAMTDGERRHVDVDEDFNIIVDGQPLQTLSGSGKSVVNLALRIGLGQVLTSKVLPIFMGDEIDKDMDQGRASATHSTMQNLREYLTQIILVTHKEIEADQVIQL